MYAGSFHRRNLMSGIGRGSIAFIAALILAGCGGTTMRVAKDQPGQNSGPVALAPEPEPSPDSTASTQPVLEPASAGAPAKASADSAHPKGYAPYTNSGGDLELRRIGQWTHTGVAESRRLVIRDANAWSQFWSELGVGERPAVDFTQNLVIAAASGQHATGGFEIAVQRVGETNGELTIEVVETSPGPNCITATALSQPVDVVTVPVVGVQTWSFVERKEVRGCR
jgi:PrcB C-terminal